MIIKLLFLEAKTSTVDFCTFQILVKQEGVPIVFQVLKWKGMIINFKSITPSATLSPTTDLMDIQEAHEWLLDVNNFTALLIAVVANLAVIYFMFQSPCEEIHTFKWIISIQAMLELADAIVLYVTKVVSTVLN